MIYYFTVRQYVEDCEAKVDLDCYYKLKVYDYLNEEDMDKLHKMSKIIQEGDGRKAFETYVAKKGIDLSWEDFVKYTEEDNRALFGIKMRSQINGHETSGVCMIKVDFELTRDEFQMFLLRKMKEKELGEFIESTKLKSG